MLRLLIACVYLVEAKKSKKKQSAKDRQQTRFKELLTSQPQCYIYATEELSYNCSAYQISPDCYNQHLTFLEIGEDNDQLKNKYFACVVKQGTLGY
jgi:hypothetical protein